VFIRFRNPLERMPAVCARAPMRKALPWLRTPRGAPFLRLRVQIDDNARGDVTKDYYGRRPEPDGLWKNRTGAIYKIPAGDLIIHTGGHDARIQQFTPGRPAVPMFWMQYDIVVNATTMR